MTYKEAKAIVRLVNAHECLALARQRSAHEYIRTGETNGVSAELDAVAGAEAALMRLADKPRDWELSS